MSETLEHLSLAATKFPPSDCSVTTWTFARLGTGFRWESLGGAGGFD